MATVLRCDCCSDRYGCNDGDDYVGGSSGDDCERSGGGYDGDRDVLVMVMMVVAGIRLTVSGGDDRADYNGDGDDVDDTDISGSADDDHHHRRRQYDCLRPHHRHHHHRHHHHHNYHARFV